MNGWKLEVEMEMELELENHLETGGNGAKSQVSVRHPTCDCRTRLDASKRGNISLLP